jgi:hypothetical protein
LKNYFQCIFRQQVSSTARTGEAYTAEKGAGRKGEEKSGEVTSSFHPHHFFG